jgi:ribonuclease HII
MPPRRAAACRVAGLSLFAGEPVERVAGVDEAGRGPLAGPVGVAAVVFDPAGPHQRPGRLQAAQRARREMLTASSNAPWPGVVLVDVDTIDRLNIYQATLQGMRAWSAPCSPWPRSPASTATWCPGPGAPAQALVGGDGIDRAIMAASILAKVSRDRYMQDAACAPAVRLRAAQGLPGTPAHLAALAEHGPCPQHRAEASRRCVLRCRQTTEAQPPAGPLRQGQARPLRPRALP